MLGYAELLAVERQVRVGKADLQKEWLVRWFHKLTRYFGHFAYVAVGKADKFFRIPPQIVGKSVFGIDMQFAD